MSYTSISITAPDSAEQGAVVPMSTKVTNVSAYSLLFRVKLYAVRDIYAVPTPGETIGSVEVTIGPRQSQLISGTFIMPAWDAIVLIMVYRFIDYWDFDVYATKVVSVEARASIVKKELEYSGSGDGAVPVAGVPRDVRAKLHVWGQNDMDTSQNIGILWFVYDPDGVVAEEYTDWKWGTLGPGQTHEFISSGQFDLNKLGIYTAQIDLLMGSQDNPEVVAEFIGEICTVVPAEPFVHQFSIADFGKV